MLITLSASAMRARIQSMIALRASLSSRSHSVLTPDRNFALNQQLVLHFLTAMMKVAPSVAEFKVEPADYYENPDAELMLQVALRDREGIDAKRIRGLLENYISLMTLASLPGADTSAAERKECVEACADLLASLSDELSGTDFSRLRISRTI